MPAEPPQPNRREIDHELAEFRREFKELKEAIEPVIEIWSALSGMVTVLKWVGWMAKWLAAIGAAIGLAWAVLTHRGSV